MKYIVTVETNYDTEVSCTIAPHKDVTDNLTEAKTWVINANQTFPASKYHIYELTPTK